MSKVGRLGRHLAFSSERLIVVQDTRTSNRDGRCPDSAPKNTSDTTVAFEISRLLEACLNPIDPMVHGCLNSSATVCIVLSERAQKRMHEPVDVSSVFATIFLCLRLFYQVIHWK